MKLAIYTLAGVMMAGMAAGLALSGSQPVAAPRCDLGKHEVYVDLDRLVRMHPAWEALSMTNSVVADMRDNSVSSAAATSNFETLGQGSAKAPKVDTTTREQLLTRTIQVADEALLKLEAQQQEAVDVRLMQRRETMEKSAEAEVMVKVRDIENQAAATSGQVAREHCSDRINAELKVAALKSKSGKPGIDAKVNASKLETAEANLSRIKQECTLQTNKVWNEAKTSIDNLWSDAATRTNASLSILESGEKREIKNRAASSRNEILRDLLSLYDLGNSVRSYTNDERANVKISAVALAASNNGSLGGWRGESTGLEKRIRQDVRHAVLKIARDEGVNVVFTKDPNRVPDATARFMRLMSERAWYGYGPIISTANGS